jgi:hypothetical protein
MKWRRIGKTVVRNDVRYCVGIHTDRVEQLLGQVGAAVARAADDDNKTEAAVERSQLGLIASQERGEQLIGAKNNFLSQRMRQHFLGDTTRVFQAFAEFPRHQIFRNLVLPRCVRRSCVDAPVQVIDECRGYWQLLVSQFDFNAHNNLSY